MDALLHGDVRRFLSPEASRGRSLDVFYEQHREANPTSRRAHTESLRCLSSDNAAVSPLCRSRLIKGGCSGNRV